MFRSLLATICLVVLCQVPVQAQEDAIGVPGPLVYEDIDFHLVWTSHPVDELYKQEYVPEGETVEAYGQMFMVDVLLNGLTPLDAASVMIDGLAQRRGQDPLVNYDIIQNDSTGEVILDFLLSDDSSGTYIVEWNAYRYVPLDDGIAMFGISRRGYDDETSQFLADLAAWRPEAILALASMELPEIALAE
jgi:hypothetical protein